MKKYLYGLKPIMYHLLTEEKRKWKMFLFQRKTNYNLALAHLYLNYQDLEALKMILQAMPQPPLCIKINPALKKNYQFHPLTKTLEVKQSLAVSPLTQLLQSAEENIWGDLQKDAQPNNNLLCGDK
ncbi:MAG: hypothetical protein Q8888_02110 [Vigna little leaf phytoplasma]|nr:hypothetical protein [Vigna little leaf phytoplasma]